MDIFIILATVVVLCFGFVLLFGAPYLPTLTKQAHIALDMIDLEKGQILLELGSGDGKILLAAARRGWNAVGFELNPILVLISRIRTWKYRKQIKIVWGDFWQTQLWPDADGIFGFVLQKHMKRLDIKIDAWHTRPIRLASFAFTIPGRKTLQEKQGVYLYEYK